ncbi:hypothetical protein E3P92_03143 [Wallemia ichthyophaga]|uniref:NADH dehydrogenase [ubiquinone] 1 beta subcomplex subunit 11, mitochondrial n=2 Tax=Wallemia ichthyophaga TaxID=245174 RepID=A0A4T0FKU8_WALIC|nr:uncharacterized protein J056_003401 [Wallemia ichthyophaga EXF-994]TIA69325.1 hypothetical protein E3P91_03667 [Wallemia ichthyophaga]EOR02839.1 hypothetical protein J056_003401 [Wallemia ichthyophaga EXF-994]TIA79636.1 hypothetical protein E3P98_03145 [Wallemia ichthyophaga]TIA88858.1 hypothetical protein E3P97_03317 [Wallemia ichthyophaga]TIA96900.1 hypothetical protein E3P95_03069 [Wallemia ichthyophaga]
MLRLRSTQFKSLAKSQQLRFAGGGPHLHEPTGHLFAEKPLPNGQKRKWENWEPIYYFGFYAAIAAAGIGYYYKPDSTIQTWASNEAKSRMEQRGELPKYTPSNSN